MFVWSREIYSYFLTCPITESLNCFGHLLGGQVCRRATHLDATTELVILINYEEMRVNQDLEELGFAVFRGFSVLKSETTKDYMQISILRE